MNKRIFKATFLCACISGVVLLSLFFTSLYDQLTLTTKNELKQESLYIAQGLSQSDLNYFEGLNSDNRITLISRDGRVLYDSSHNEQDMENHADRSEIIEAFNTGEGYSERYSSSMHEKSLYYAVLLDDGSVLRVSTYQKTIGTLLLQMFSHIVWAIVLTALISAFLAHAVSTAIVKPINAIDPEHPHSFAVYEELQPLLARMETQNITIREQMSGLNKAKEEFKALTENLNEGLILLNADKSVLFYNRPALECFDTENVHEGDSVYTLCCQKDFYEALARVYEGQRTQFVFHSGGKDYEIRLSPILSEEKIEGAVILSLDISLLRHQEELRKQFSANVSHQLKTPLTTISGYAELMKNGVVDSDEVAGIATEIYTQARHLIDMVNDIMHLSRLDEGQSVGHEESFDLSSLIQNVIHDHKADAERKNIAVHFAETPLNVTANPLIFEEMLANLLSNAIKYGKQDGHCSIAYTKGDMEWSIEVKDDGIGIAKEERERIFERFYRAQTDQCVEGSGLGLSIVKHAVELYDGHIEVQSEPGQGSSFTMNFPNKILTQG